ncbi:hypothetical protein GCM10011384_18850 [Psychrobacillus lasiicapitis]|nr:hypothetical protein GCM10011384_18850 [Psychrobacillus lasiicapitis]
MTNILLRKENNIAYITINREEALNCFNYDTLHQLQQVVDAISIDPEVKVIIITGAGDRSFSAGADLKERKTL